MCPGREREERRNAGKESAGVCVWGGGGTEDQR